MQLIHHSPLGALEIAGVLGRPEPGEPFEVDDDIAETLLEQGDLFTTVPAPDLSVPQLRELAKTQGVDITGLRKKDDIAAAIASHHEPAEIPEQDPVTEPIQESAQAAAADQGTDSSEESDA